jgi:hypothetical protein
MKFNPMKKWNTRSTLNRTLPTNAIKRSVGKVAFAKRKSIVKL